MGFDNNFKMIRKLIKFKSNVKLTANDLLREQNKQILKSQSLHNTIKSKFNNLLVIRTIIQRNNARIFYGFLNYLITLIFVLLMCLRNSFYELDLLTDEIGFCNIDSPKFVIHHSINTLKFRSYWKMSDIANTRYALF